jgi:hypothetical protein
VTNANSFGHVNNGNSMTLSGIPAGLQPANAGVGGQCIMQASISSGTQIGLFGVTAGTMTFYYFSGGAYSSANFINGQVAALPGGWSASYPLL